MVPVQSSNFSSSETLLADRDGRDLEPTISGFRFVGSLYSITAHIQLSTAWQVQGKVHPRNRERGSGDLAENRREASEQGIVSSARHVSARCIET